MQALKILKTLSKEPKFINKWWEYWLDVYRFPNGASGEYHYVNSKGAVMIVPLLDDGSLVMTKQYRYFNQKISIEFPGGGKKEELSYEESARQELLEEGGYRSDSLVCIGEYNPYNGVTNEITKVYLALDLAQEQAQPDESEEFEIIRFTESEIITKIENGDIWDGMTLAAWSLYFFSKYKR